MAFELAIQELAEQKMVGNAACSSVAHHMETVSQGIYLMGFSSFSLGNKGR